MQSTMLAKIWTLIFCIVSAGVDVDVDVGNSICVDLYVVSACVSIDVCIGICVDFYVVSAGVDVDMCIEFVL